MRISAEVQAMIDSKIQDPQVRVLLMRIIEKAYPNEKFTEYHELEDGVMNAYDCGFREGQTDMANDLYKLVLNIVS